MFDLITLLFELTKEFHYKQWKKSVDKNNLLGDADLYLAYSNFRRKLKHVIRSAKRLYYCRKFDKVSGNMKKTWALINELRGKAKTGIKASFKIDGELVKDKRVISNGFKEHNAGARGIKMITSSRRAG